MSNQKTKRGYTKNGYIYKAHVIHCPRYKNTIGCDNHRIIELKEGDTPRSIVAGFVGSRWRKIGDRWFCPTCFKRYREEEAVR